MPQLDRASAQRLAKAHPLLRKLFTEVAKRADIVILESQRGRAAQELAYRTKRSKARFGQSAHNWTPAIALDVCPKPIDWKNTKPFVRLAKEIVLPLAKEMEIPLRWGGDWNMNGKTEDEKFVDMPHYELTPWRSFAKNATLFDA
jgi:peptidoglycan L-alanyl-D-glutamate endopeptidase CwlK